MLKVNKKKSEPEEFTKYKSKHKIINWDSFTPEIKQVLKQYLLEEQENSCCPYCEIEINLENSHIEHIKPKNIFPNLLADTVFIKDRSEYAAQAYQEAFEAGISIPECDKIASGVLFDGLFFSPFDMVFEVVSQEFDTQLADEDLRPFALKIFPELVPYFKKYENEIDEDFQHSAAYQSLYTELTGAIELWIEENGIS